MRVIGGTARGTRLRTLALAHLRPMLDRVREALFNIVRSDVAGARVLDLFSGCGALGIEALSRGAQWCVFVERDGRLVRLLGANVERCGFASRCHILRMDVFDLPHAPPPEGACPAELVFVDPPYAFVEDPNRRGDLFAALEGMRGAWIASGALLVLHHGPLPHALWPTEALRCIDRRLYGNSQLSFFRVGEAPEDEA